MLLLEAYEQLEQDCGKEIDKALAKEREERKQLERKAEFLQVCVGVGGGREEAGEGRGGWEQ